MDGLSDTLVAARSAFADHRWTDARAGFLAARALGPLSAADMSALSEAAWWAGAIEESLSAAEESYRLYLHGGEPDHRQAAIQAMDLGFSWFLRGEEAMGSGWITRAQRLLEGRPECPEQGYLRTLEIEAALAQGDFDGAISVAQEVGAIAARFADETLAAFALVCEGVATIRKGRVGPGLAILDEAMLPVVAGRVRPVFAGHIYCQLMSVCHDLADLRRAEQWTDATSRWCAGFDSAVMFLGVCRVHRAQLLQVRGRWAQAEEEIRRVCEELAAMNVVAVGLATYELAEVRRQRGDLAGAEEAYAAAHRHGRDPQPGLALCWLAQGRARAALEALVAAESSTADPLDRARLWDALVEVAVAAGDVGTARRARDGLSAAADTYASSGLAAAAAVAQGRLRLAEGDAAGAVEWLRDARRRWQELGATWRVAKVRLVLAEALRAAGDDRAATLERDAADRALAGLGVSAAAGGGRLPAGLTARQAEVLGLVAQGLSNREVAAALFLSEKTVARHLANLYVKLGVGSRTAAAAFAHSNGLAGPPPA